MCVYGGIGYNGQLYSNGGHGTLFQITPAGDFTNLVLFTGDESPFGGLVQASDGNLYGMTRQAGANDSGTIFRLSVPMAPVFQSSSNLGGQIALSWSSVAGQKYQLQYSSDLSPTSWTNLSETISASDGITTAEDDSGLNPVQRFYRVVLLP